MPDVLSEVIGALHIRTTLFAMADLRKPWGVRFPAGDGAYFHTVSGQPCWLRMAGDEDPTRLGPGEITLLAHGAAHRITSSRRGAARVEFDPTTWRPNALADQVLEPDVSAPSTTLVCGAVDVLTPDAQPLLGLLPSVLIFGADESAATGLSLTLALLGHETDRARPGTQTMLARLGDMLLVQLVRLWLDQPDTAARGWLLALHDAQLNAALQAMHADPAAPWTVDALATHARLSRSRFAERFTATIGVAPLAYLTRWRLTLGAGMLRDGRTVSQVSRAVGYTSEPAFSRAFHRHHGQPPSRLRQ